jgi:hypothetical protein
MRAQPGQTGITRPSLVRRRRANVCTRSLVFLMVVPRQHSLAEAARFSGRHQSPCSKRLQAQSPVAVSPLASLSKQPARQGATARQTVPALPWALALVIDRTLHQRASLPPANATTVTHGHGCLVGHPWTPMVRRLHDRLLPLRPIPFSRQR